MTIHTFTDVEAVRKLEMTRIFAAPRALVFEACTTPRHIQNWWCCRDYTMPVCDIDLREGGAYLYEMRGPQGDEFAFKGEYLEIVAPERLVCTQIFDMEPWSNDEALVTICFEEQDDKTTMHSTIVFPSVESCQGAKASGMEAGIAETYDRLADLLCSMA